MAKLYAEITSDKGGRTASKGGDSIVVAKFSKQNQVICTVGYLGGDTLQIDHYQNGRVVKNQHIQLK